MRILAFVLTACLLAACAQPLQAPPTPTATLPSPTPTITPTDTPLSPTPTTSASPAPLLPVGFVTYDFLSNRARVHDLQGGLIGDMPVPAPGQILHIPGRLEPGVSTLPLLYRNSDARALQLITDDAVTDIYPFNELRKLVGVPGQPLVAYSDLQFPTGDSITLTTQLYAGDVLAMPGAAPVFSYPSTESLSIVPLALSSAGVWYTYEPYGIGGDIVFPVYRGLEYLDLASGQTARLLEPERVPSALSPDLSWLAFASSYNGQLILRYLATGEETAFPLLPTSDRGAGYAVFSPDNRYVAWIEAGGFLYDAQPPLQVTVRIATVTGELLAEIPQISIIEEFGPAPFSVIPVAFIPQQEGAALLLQVTNRDLSLILRVNPDGSALEKFAEGRFGGVVYR